MDDPFAETGTESKWRSKDYKSMLNALMIDKNNTLAVKYLKEMGVTPKDVISMKESSSRIDVDAGYTDEDQFKSDLESFVEKSLENIDNPDKTAESYKEINHNKFNLLYVSVGLILGILAFWLLILPTKLNSANKENRELQLSHSEEISKKNVAISDLEKQISDLEKQVADVEKEETKAQEQKKEADSAFEVIKKSIPNTAYENLCSEAGRAISERRYTDAIDMCTAALQIQ